jgi:hypothetical protein
MLSNLSDRAGYKQLILVFVKYACKSGYPGFFDDSCVPIIPWSLD